MEFSEAYRIAMEVMNELTDIYPNATLKSELAGRPVADIVAARMADAFISHDVTSGRPD